MVFSLTLVLLLASQALSGAAVPFNDRRGLVEVEAILNDSLHAILALDTGADDFYLDLKFAVSNHLIDSGATSERPVTGVEGQSEAVRINLNSLQFGDYRRDSLQAVVVDLAKFIPDSSHGYPDGFIGNRILRHSRIRIDYPNRRLSLEPADTEFVPGDEYFAIPFRYVGHFLVVDVAFDDAPPVPMIFDLGASYTSLSPDLIKRLHLQEIATMKYFALPKLSLSEPITRKYVICEVRDTAPLKKRLGGGEFDGVLGKTFFRKYSFVIDYGAQELYFRKLSD